MEYRTLGNSDLKVSRICMGCMGFGDPTQGQHTWTLGYDQTREIIKRGLELGVNFYDTAIIYQNGTSEQFVGKALPGTPTPGHTGLLDCGDHTLPAQAEGLHEGMDTDRGGHEHAALRRHGYEESAG